MSQSFVCSAVRGWRSCSVCWLLQQPRRLRGDVAMASTTHPCWLVDEREAFSADVWWCGVLRWRRCPADTFTTSLPPTVCCQIILYSALIKQRKRRWCSWHSFLTLRFPDVRWPFDINCWAVGGSVSSWRCLMSRGMFDKGGGEEADSCLQGCGGWQRTSAWSLRGEGLLILLSLSSFSTLSVQHHGRAGEAACADVILCICWQTHTHLKSRVGNQCWRHWEHRFSVGGCWSIASVWVWVWACMTSEAVSAAFLQALRRTRSSANPALEEVRNNNTIRNQNSSYFSKETCEECVLD